MTHVFADTPFYVALLNVRDELHAKAVDWATKNRAPIVTTEFVLLEVANFFKQPKDRDKFSFFVKSLESDPATTVIPCNSGLFHTGLERFASRLDKERSLTDCISFDVMEARSLADALTSDHHFAQAGFAALL